jgi:NAD-dependent oxidoreductase involved in siderophore biosynthesis
MDGEDRQVLHDILGRGEGFGHRQHVELAWRYLGRHDPDQAADSVAAAIRQVAEAHGQPAKFHQTITRSWVQCVAVHQERWPAASFPEFLDRNEALLDGGLLGHFYSPALLASHEARSRWVAPDLRALPALAGA